jgi:hypothetical protein
MSEGTSITRIEVAKLAAKAVINTLGDSDRVFYLILKFYN